MSRAFLTLPRLRFAADRRTLAFIAAYFVGFASFWWLAPRTAGFTALGTLVLMSLSWFAAIITHNTMHSPIWKTWGANRITQLALSLSYGFAVSEYVPGHNLSHHKYVQSRRDVMRTSKVRFGSNALNFLTFAFVVIPSVIVANGRYLKSPRGRALGFRRQRQLEVVCVWSVKALFFLLDWRRAVFFVLLPHLWAVWSITSVNYLQHDGCDPDHPYNHSRNFVGRFFNWFHFNNGFHGMHHENPNLHWSKLPEAHARIFHPHIDPALEQRSLAMYIWNAFIAPGKRLDLRGRPVHVPEEGPGRGLVAEGGVSVGSAAFAREAPRTFGHRGRSWRRASRDPRGSRDEISRSSSRRSPRAGTAKCPGRGPCGP